jgi:uncharacterized protein (TIGR02284 family)
MKRDEIIDTLNELIKICNDGVDGFTVCSEYARDTPELKTLLTERSHECALAAYELSTLVRGLCGAPTTNTNHDTTRAGWLNVKTTIDEKLDHVVLEECERGEDVTKLAYERVLAKKLPESTRLVVERQYQLVLNNYDQIKRLCDESM